MIKAQVSRIDLQFITPGQTSRGTLYSKPSWFFVLEQNGYSGVGECSVIPGLNPEYTDGYEQKIFEIAEKINSGVVPSLDEQVDELSGRIVASAAADLPKSGVHGENCRSSGLVGAGR